MAGRRRRVKEIKDEIEVFSLNSRKTRKIPRRHFETDPKIHKHGVDAGGQLINRTDTAGSSSQRQRICEIAFDGDEESVNAGNVRSAYYKRKEKQLEKWDNVRSLMVKCFVEACCLPEEKLCVLCEEQFATIRCLECGYGQYYCHGCASLIHRDRSIFHFLEEWKEGTFVDLQNIPNLTMPKGCTHAPNCFENIRRICVITTNGFQKHCDITFCDCIPDGIILIKNGLWPVSPTAPMVALQLELMAHLESLFLEAQLSLNSFCNSIKWKQVFSGRPAIVSDLYNSLSSNDTFEQYRQFIYNIRFLRTLCPDASNGTECPACPKESGTTFWNFDACFGLFRKKSAGKHPLPSVHGPLYFEEQDIVDDFLRSYKISRKETELENEKECSQFQAGGDFDGIHCKGKNNLFDEKAVFGCVCRHEYPLRFLDIKHGERFGYIIYLLEQLLELDRNKPIQRKVVYDIGCKLHRHVELTNNEKILGKVAFMLPSFHAFAHSTPCQMKYSIFYQEGSGFSNGEQCERLWSYLRCFSSMTREMTAAHRQDALTDALLYYSRKILMKTGFLTVNRLTRAKDARTTSSAELQKLLVDLQADKEQVLVWEKQLLDMSENRRKGQSGVHEVPWQMKYIRLLLLHRQLSDDLANCADSVENVTVAPVLNKLRRIDKQLKQVEEKNNVRRRWKIDQPTVFEFVEAVEEEERREVIEKLRAVAFDRWFLLSLKRKYSTGQKIAKILTRSINVKVANMKEILRNYNRRSAIKMNLVPGKVNKIEYNDVVDIQSAIYQGLPSFEGDAIPSDVKRKAVELNVINRRAAEEIDLCRQDMICTINHLITEKKKIVLAAEYHSSNPVSSCYSRGAVSLLNQKIIQLDGMISCYGKIFIDAEGITRDEVDSFSLQRVVLLNRPFPITASQLEDLSDDETEAIVEAESDDCGAGLHDEIVSDNDFSLFLSEDSD